MFAGPAANAGADASPERLQFAAPGPAIVDHLYVHNQDPGAGPEGATVTYTLEINGTDTPLSVTLAPEVTDGSDTTDAVNVSEGDLVSMKVTIGDQTLTASPQFLSASVRWRGL